MSIAEGVSYAQYTTPLPALLVIARGKLLQNLGSILLRHQARPNGVLSEGSATCADYTPCRHFEEGTT